MPVLVATVAVALIGLIIGLLLVGVGKKFAVKVDEKEAAVRSFLPGNNCGGCGYAGCDALAAAIAAGEAPVDACPVGGTAVATQVGHVMGVEANPKSKKVAFVKCAGDCEKAPKKANYIGIADCQQAVAAGIGNKACGFGCLGFGSCAKVCPFGAITIEKGVAKVNREKCKACKKCVAACPKNLIEIIPDSVTYTVACSNREKGPAVKSVCTAGCIGCTLCVKQCENDAIAMDGNISRIDFKKCVSCGKCAEKCPTKAIVKR